MAAVSNRGMQSVSVYYSVVVPYVFFPVALSLRDSDYQVPAFPVQRINRLMRCCCTTAYITAFLGLDC